MRIGDTFIAVDWGTTNRRAFRIEDGVVVAHERNGRGVMTVAVDDYPAELASIRSQLGDVPMLLAGMVGSSIGWCEIPYVTAPAGLDQIAAALVAMDECTAIIPGVSLLDGARADIMRGEEVQLLGACAAGLVPPDALVAQPGTHCKWASMRGGRIERFTTAMTGELFALLRNHSILARQLCVPASVGDAFLDGVAAGTHGDIAARLFGVRAVRLLNRRDDAGAASFVSGLLIGNDVANRLRDDDRSIVNLIADAVLGPLYAAAIAAHGRDVKRVDSDQAFVAGMTHLARMLT